jgi:biopolymer transport protein ExbD
MRDTPMRPAPTSMQAEPNVTPFLDVLLVLLILFMFLCLNQQKVLTAQLPDPSARPADTMPAIVLEVRPDSTYAINTQPVAHAELSGRLRAIYAGRLTKTIIVRGTPGVRYQDVVTAVDIARGAGVIAIGLASGR